MEKIAQKNIFKNIGIVFEKAEHSGLKTEFFKSVQPELKTLANHLKTTENQAFFFAIIFAIDYGDASVSKRSLIRYFGCNPMKLLEFNQDFEELMKRGYIKVKAYRNRVEYSKQNEEYVINEKIKEALIKNLPMVEIDNKEQHKDVVSLLEEVHNLSREIDYDISSAEDLFQEVDILISKHTHFPLIKKIKQFSFNPEDNYIYLFVIWKAIIGDNSINLSDLLDVTFEATVTKFRKKQSFINGQSILVKNDLVEIDTAIFSNDLEIKLSKTSYQFLKDLDILLTLNKKKDEGLIAPDKIAKKELLFDTDIRRQLNLVENSLQEETFQEIQNRLTEKALPKGVTILLHGAPGTGKTEWAKQVAKLTNREIMRVEISQTKSMWFGESEKIIKRIFTDYKYYSDNAALTPILLFNEADAIIQKRKENSTSNVSNTENAIQNILLEELENFEGILIATTNLADNLDHAFERRFLFKVNFPKPANDIRALIWQSKFPKLNKADCLSLAEQFDFSGGQIDNIIRKAEMQEIVNGKKSDFKAILNFCEEESLTEVSQSIGFKSAEKNIKLKPLIINQND